MDDKNPDNPNAGETQQIIPDPDAELEVPAAATAVPQPGPHAHDAYPSAVRDQSSAAGAYFDSPQHMLNVLGGHAMTTHGLAVDKEMMLKVHDYLVYHLANQGFDVERP